MKKKDMNPSDNDDDFYSEEFYSFGFDNYDSNNLDNYEDFQDPFCSYNEFDDIPVNIEISNANLTFENQKCDNYDQNHIQKGSTLICKDNAKDTSVLIDTGQNNPKLTEANQNQQQKILNILPCSQKAGFDSIPLSKRLHRYNTLYHYDGVLFPSSENLLMFKEGYYSTFTKKKKFSKKFVKIIHQCLQDQFGFEAMTRDEYRDIGLYFLHYLKFGESIIRYLRKEKNTIIKKHSELSNL